VQRDRIAATETRCRNGIRGMPTFHLWTMLCRSRLIEMVVVGDDVKRDRNYFNKKRLETLDIVAVRLEAKHCLNDVPFQVSFKKQCA
jgi:hypothetical protein